MNSNGLMLLTLCSEMELIITNTVFQQPDSHKATWMYPRSKHWHIIDYIITRGRDIRDIHITRAMRGADCFTDHILLRCKASFRLAYRHCRRPSSRIKKKLDIKKLSNPRNVKALQEALAVNLEVTQSTNCPKESWSAPRDTV